MNNLRTQAGEAAAAARPAAATRAARQRERILDAAENCFIESGFQAASMAHIAQTAGMSAGLIYRYFDSKASIVKAIIERHLETDGAMRHRPAQFTPKTSVPRCSTCSSAGGAAMIRR